MYAISDLLQQLEGSAELMSAAIESKDWDGLNELLRSRQETLEILCAAPLSGHEREAAVTVMVSMQVSDRQLLPLVQEEKVVLQKQASTLVHDRKAIQAYQAE